MQIFVVESHPHGSALSLCDKHVLSQIGETAQLLALAHLRNNETVPPVKVLVPSTRHLNHPCAKWVAASVVNYRWTFELAKNLCEEYTHRYHNRHAYEPDIHMMMHAPFRLIEENKGRTPAPAVMPEEFVDKNSIVNSYRNYYRYKASVMPMNWTKRTPPSWFM